MTVFPISDVVGHFVGVGEVNQTTRGHPPMTIKLENLEDEQITCSLWGRYTKEIDEYIATHNPSSEPTIVAIQCAQRILFQGQVRVQTSRYAAKIHINPDIPEVNALKRRLMEGNDQVTSRITQITDEDTDILSGDNIASIKEIKKCKKAGDYVTLASIYDLDTTIGWYYDSCKICRTKCQLRVDNHWYCNKVDCEGCMEGLKTNFPRYHVVDPLNDCAIFTLFENLTGTLVKVSASELLVAQEKPKTPEELAIFIGKRYVFKVHVKQDYNIDQKSRSYSVISMSDDPEVMKNWEKKDQALHIISSEAEAGHTDCQLNDVQDHTPLKRRVSRMLEVVRDEDDNPPTIDQESTAKKIMKIKMEKD
ncbi:uncharacterized protein LOC141651941 [Silene latifolia]|uniref:uncharacterized protein LOC141651941 n=1 Tax=Silene latifolia TaxID=37657 RepID=UPI003D7868D0